MTANKLTCTNLSNYLTFIVSFAIITISFFEQLSLLVSQQRLYLCCASSADSALIWTIKSVLFLFNDYSISQKGVGIIQEALWNWEQGFCIKSNELSINSISKQLLYWCWTPFLKGRYPQHSNSIVFSFSVKLGSDWYELRH
jgi:hypothetical protein